MTNTKLIGFGLAIAISAASFTTLEAQTKKSPKKAKTPTAQSSSTIKVKPTPKEMNIYKDYIFALDIDNQDNPRGYSIRPIQEGTCAECANSWERERVEGVAKTYKVKRKDVYKAVKKVLDYNK
ncbi:MAG: hypothetical protein V4642_14950 [Bacteroidota bacterium]